MKKLFTFLTLISTSTIAQTTQPKFSELELRIQSVDNFATQNLPQIKMSFELALKEIEEFKDQKLVNQDEKQKTNFLEKINQFKSEVESAENSLSTGGSKTQMSELNKLIKEKEIYTQAKKTLQNMEKDSSNSPKLKKYYSLTKDKKYTLARVTFAVLNSADKSNAQEYEKNYNYVEREFNRQEFIQKEIKNLKDKVVKSLSYPENAVSKIKSVSENEQAAFSQFSIFKKEIEDSVQFDYLLPSSWSMGLFTCEPGKKSQYFRFLNYPKMVVLDNEGNYNAVIKLSSSDPKKLDMIYHCDKMGSFGVCMENKTKKLCQLDSSCAEALTQMEGTFERNVYFLRYQNSFVPKLLKSKKDEMLNPKNVNLISELTKLNRLGFYSSKNELYNLIDPIIEKAKTIQANTPEDFYKKIKTEVVNLEKSETIRLQKMPGYSTGSTKATYSLQALSYMIATLDSELSKIKESDILQKFSFENCDENTADEFCQSYASFQNKAKSFEAVEEIQNIVPDECPRVVFRFKQTDK